MKRSTTKLIESKTKTKKNINSKNFESKRSTGQRKSVKAKGPSLIHSRDVPATQGMIKDLQKQIKAEILSFEKKIDARFSEVDARFNKMEARFSEIDARFSEVDARFNKIEARFSEIDARFSEVDARFNKIEATLAVILSEVHRIAILVEEQNARNKIVLEGYEQLYKRMDRLEFDVDRRLKTMEEIILKPSV